MSQQFFHHYLLKLHQFPVMEIINFGRLTMMVYTTIHRIDMNYIFVIILLVKEIPGGGGRRPCAAGRATPWRTAASATDGPGRPPCSARVCSSEADASRISSCGYFGRGRRCLSGAPLGQVERPGGGACCGSDGGGSPSAASHLRSPSSTDARMCTARHSATSTSTYQRATVKKGCALC